MARHRGWSQAWWRRVCLPLCLAGCSTVPGPPHLTVTGDAAALSHDGKADVPLADAQDGAGTDAQEDAAPVDTPPSTQDTAPVDVGAQDVQPDVAPPAKLPPMPKPKDLVGMQVHLGGGVADRLVAGLRPSAGGLALVGSTRDSGAGGEEAWAVRQDPCGGTVWARTYGGDHDDGFAAVAEAQDDGLLLAGHSASNGGSDDVLLVRTDALGSPVWSRTYGGVDEDAAVAVTGGPGGWTVLAGSRSFGGGSPPQLNPLMLRVAADGTLLWARAWWQTGPTSPAGLAIASEGGVLAVGQTAVKGQQQDAWLARVGPNGDLKWARTFGGPLEDRLTAASETPDQGFLLAGQTRNFGSVLGDLLILRVDAAGQLLWARRAGTQEFDEARAIWPVPKGFLLAGTTAGAGAGHEDYLLTAWSESGEPEWMRTIGSGGADFLAAAGAGGGEGPWMTGWQMTSTGGSAGWLVQVESPEQPQCGSNTTVVASLKPGPAPTSAWQTVVPYETADPAVQPQAFAVQVAPWTEVAAIGCQTTCP